MLSVSECKRLAPSSSLYFTMGTLPKPNAVLFSSVVCHHNLHIRNMLTRNTSAFITDTDARTHPRLCFLKDTVFIKLVRLYHDVFMSSINLTQRVISFHYSLSLEGKQEHRETFPLIISSQSIFGKFVSASHDLIRAVRE